MTDPHDSPLDLSALDPHDDPRREERIIGVVMGTVRADRPTDINLLTAVLSFARPALVTAAAIVVAGGAVLLGAAQGQPAPPATIAGFLGVPAPVEEWAEGGSLDTLELLNDLGGSR